MQIIPKINLNDLVNKVRLTAAGKENQSKPVIIWFDQLINEFIDGELITDYLHLITKLKNSQRIAATDSPFPITINDKGEEVISIPNHIMKLQNNELQTRVMIMCLYIGDKELLNDLIKQATIIHDTLGVATFLFLSLSWKGKIEISLTGYNQFLYQAKLS